MVTIATKTLKNVENLYNVVSTLKEPIQYRNLMIRTKLSAENFDYLIKHLERLGLIRIEKVEFIRLISKK